MLLFILALSLPFALFAAYIGPPSSSAGVVEREIKEEYSAKEIDPDNPPQIKIPDQQLDISGDEELEIEEITFIGNTVISCEELTKALTQYTHCTVPLKRICDICETIQEIYVERGYFLARAYPPVQEINDGKLTIAIVEGTLGSVKVQGNEHYSEKYIAGYFSRFRGQALNYNNLISSLLLLNENRDLVATAVLTKGDKWNTADLIIQVKDERPLYTYIDINNYGSDPTTLYRSGIRIDAGNTLTSGDCLSLTGVIGFPPSGLYFTNSSYSIPINHRGTKFDIAFLYSAFRVNTLTALDLTGVSAIGTGTITHPIVRKKKVNADLFLSFDYKQIKNLTHNDISSYDRLRVVGFGSTIDWTDSIWGRNFFDPSIYIGIPDFLGGSKAVDPLASRQGSGGRFFLFDLTYKRIQQLFRSGFIFLKVSGQLTPNKIPLAEQIYLGGIDTVRGYPTGSGLGDYGYCANLELRVSPPYDWKVWKLEKTVRQMIQGIVFIDHGGVFLNGSAAGEQNGLLLTSVGAGLRLFGPYDFFCNLDAGFPLTDKPQSSIPGQSTSFYTLYFKFAWQRRW